MTEFELIRQLFPTLATNAQLVTGAGHDCALVDLGLPGKLLFFKTDAVVEGIHFTTETPPEQIGRKALARALSDAAAVAGTPNSCLVTLGLPKGFDADRVTAMYRGLNALAAEHGVSVAGGETTRTGRDTFLSIALIGTVARDHPIDRGGARPGDALFVSGELGGSLAGRHLEFTPRLAEARWLAEHFRVGAMIDLSDGLAGDLRHLLEASGVGAELQASAIPISRAAKNQARAESSAKPPLLAALTDGEDYELLFAVPAREAVRVLDGWKAKFPGTKLSCIGKFTAERGLRLRDKEGVRTLAVHGYTHFAKS